VLHQVSGEANAKGSAADIDDTEGDECRTVKTYYDFTVTLTRPPDDPEAPQVNVWRCKKHRHNAPTSPRFVLIEGQYGRLRDVSDHYAFDLLGRRIVPKSELEGGDFSAKSTRPAAPSIKY
jgi:hypothetical protein